MLFVRYFVYNRPKSICTALTTRTTTDNNCIISHAQDTTTLQPNVFLTGIYWALGNNKELSAFPSADHSQGQLQTPQSLSVCRLRLKCDGTRGENQISSFGERTSPFKSAGASVQSTTGQRHAPAALPPGKTRYPLYRRLGGLQGRSGQVRKISRSPGFDPQTVQPVASRYTD